MERWLSGRKRLIRNQLSRVIGIVGSNPTLSSNLRQSAGAEGSGRIMLRLAGPFSLMD